MQGDSTNVLATSAGDTGEVGGAGAATGTGTGSNSSDQDDKSLKVEESERLSYGANRWPRQETLALLKIRSDMDSVFRDSSLKGPLWEEVSRKLADLGYNRSAKKCKEKFENVYKYHKRTKEGRTGKSDGKTYRFFDQLQALESHHHHLHQPQSVSAPPPPPPPPPKPQPATATATLPWSNNPPNVSHVTVPSTTNSTANIIITSQNNNSNITPTDDQPISPMPLSSSQPIINTNSHNISPNSFQNLTWHLFSSSTSSSTASDEELQSSGGKRKRKWKDFFEKLTKDVIKKQVVLQNKFLETIERLEQERIAREEAWRLQEMTRINREHEILIQERTTAAAKDAAVIAFLQKISGQQNSLQLHSIDIPHSSIFTPAMAPAPAPAPAPALVPVPVPVPVPAPAPQSTPPSAVASVPVLTSPDVSRKDDGERAIVMTSSSRWPKVEVQALIKLRTNLDTKYQENGPKGPLWEEISSRMQKLGYNRSAKRCKEKWENINKYFKKVKESSKRRPEDSKTCPYFHQLDALYKEKTKTNETGFVHGVNPVLSTIDPLMARPEQQWPLQQENQSETVIEINGRDKLDHNNIEDDDEDEDVATSEEDEGGGGFEVVASKPVAPMGNGE
ncbi:hypothetical protein JCGZ_25180 [Jatropha curcas]|uniref:Myb-like domain-containing protein n=1 Tax=Jatropha curcas TaxID=180498 RepID=A0A067LFU7_JATCU|nr:trihelix transcription factor GT-2 [Jatropha curcas]KDP42994.1 hypothetical protein JCGZ_25180 [Jatropha curcas]